MKSKTLSYLLGKTSNRNKDATNNLDKNRIKVEIENMCNEYLKTSDELLQFEVSDRDLDFVVTIVETGLISKYDIFQMDRTLFGAKLKEVEFM